MNSNISNSENNIKKIKTNTTNPTPEKVADKEDSLSIIKNLSVDGVLVNLKIFSKIKNHRFGLFSDILIYCWLSVHWLISSIYC